MKVTAYLRVATDERSRTAQGRRTKVVASNRPSDAPIYNSADEALPTVAFAIDLDVPDAMFRRAEDVVAELKVTPRSGKIAATVKPVAE